MKKLPSFVFAGLFLSFFCILTDCSCTRNSPTPTTTSDSGTTSSTQPVDISLFNTTSGTITSITDTTITVSDGSTMECYAIHTTELAKDHAMGPWCPADTTQTGGIWEDTEDNTIHTVDNTYLNILKGRGWDLVNSDGTVRRTTSTASFTLEVMQENEGWTFAEAEANGNVNTCIEATPQSQSTIVCIPKTPKKASSAASIFSSSALDFNGGFGISLNGIIYFPPEPVEKIVFYQNIAPMDVNGGHTGFALDYHYHRAIRVPNSSTKILGYMLDGYPLYGTTEPDGSTPTDLDEQHGHETSALGYHYHTYEINEFPYIVSGLTGVYGKVIRR